MLSRSLSCLLSNGNFHLLGTAVAITAIRDVWPRKWINDLYGPGYLRRKLRKTRIKVTGYWEAVREWEGLATLPHDLLR